MKRISREYYIENDTLWLARDLIGKILYCNIDNTGLSAGIISETEAYLGVEDRASHAYNNRRTKRTETMFQEGGLAYVYLCYGIHHLFNIVTNQKEIPHAILIRGIIPVAGIVHMEQRIKKEYPFSADGPGKLTRALGIKTRHNGTALDSKTIWLEDHGIQIPRNEITTGPRIGVDYAGEHAQLPWRFLLNSIPDTKII